MPKSRRSALKAVTLSLLLPLVLAAAVPLAAQDRPLWLRYPAISPDGATILFCYQGDIYKVPAAGGQAFPLTISEAYDYAPVWSHDGRSIAFASDRFGNFDVFVMPAAGGEAKRLTFHSAADVPSCFTADDKAVLFSAARQDTAVNVQYPMGLFSELYSVPVAGGEAALVLTQPAIAATVDPAGTKILYHDQKGYESDWRKHHTSSVTRDIWVYDLKTKTNTQLTTFAGEDRNPGLRRRRRRFLFPERAGRVLQRLQELAEPSGRRDRADPVRQEPGPLPDPRRRRPALLRLRRRDLHAGRRLGGAPPGRGPHRPGRAPEPGEDPAHRRRHHRDAPVPQRQGDGLRLPRRDLRRQRRGRPDQARHEYALARSAASASAPTAGRSSTPPSATTTGTSTRRPSCARKSPTSTPRPSSRRSRSSPRRPRNSSRSSRPTARRSPTSRTASS